MVIQKRRAINQRPDDILGDGQAFILQLFFAERDRAAKLLQLRIHRQRLLGLRQIGFELLQSRVFRQRLLVAGQLGLQLLVLLVSLRGRAPAASFAPRRSAGRPAWRGSRRSPPASRSSAAAARRSPRCGTGRANAGRREVLMDRQFQHAVLRAFERRRQFEHRRVVLPQSADAMAQPLSASAVLLPSIAVSTGYPPWLKVAWAFCSLMSA